MRPIRKADDVSAFLAKYKSAPVGELEAPQGIDLTTILAGNNAAPINDRGSSTERTQVGANRRQPVLRQESTVDTTVPADKYVEQLRAVGGMSPVPANPMVTPKDTETNEDEGDVLEVPTKRSTEPTPDQVIESLRKISGEGNQEPKSPSPLPVGGTTPGSIGMGDETFNQTKYDQEYGDWEKPTKTPNLFQSSFQSMASGFVPFNNSSNEYAAVAQRDKGDYPIDPSKTDEQNAQEQKKIGVVAHPARIEDTARKLEAENRQRAAAIEKQRNVI
jgi:hypothetical protein